MVISCYALEVSPDPVLHQLSTMLWWYSAPLLHHGRFLSTLWSSPSHLIHHGGLFKLCSGGLQFHSGSMLHWLCISPLSPHKQGLPTLTRFGLPSCTCSALAPLLACTVSWRAPGSRSLGLGASHRLVSWLTTRGHQTHTHHMDFILNSIPCSLITSSPVFNNMDTI